MELENIRECENKTKRNSCDINDNFIVEELLYWKA
jgi:hypothetical protein